MECYSEWFQVYVELRFFFFFQVLVILSSCYLSNRLFCYILSVPKIYSWIVLLPLPPVAGMSSWSFHLVVSWIIFCYFGKVLFFFLFFLFVCLFFVSGSLSLSSLANVFFIYFFKLHCKTYLFGFVIFILTNPCMFFLP